MSVVHTQIPTDEDLRLHLMLNALTCCHCGELLRSGQDLAECEHGQCHAPCLEEEGCEVA